MTTRLYELGRDKYFRIADGSEEVYHLDHIDGMYSLCYDKEGNVHHIAAYAPVIEVEGFNGKGSVLHL